MSPLASSHTSDARNNTPVTSEAQPVPVPVPVPVPGPGPTWRALFAFTKQSHMVPLLAAIFFTVVVAGLRSVLAIILGRIFDVIAGFSKGAHDGPQTLEAVSNWCLVLLGLGLGNCAANSAFMSLWIIFSELQADSARRHISSSLLSRRLSWFDCLDQGVASLLARIQTQTRELQLATSQVLGLLLCDIITALVSIGVALSYSWKLTLVLIATLPVSMIILVLVSRRLDPATESQKQELARSSKCAAASLQAINLVKVYNAYNREVGLYQEATTAAARQYLIQALCNALQMGYVSFWAIAIFTLGFWYGIVLVERGLRPGEVLTTFYATLSAFQAAETIMPHMLVFSKGMFAGAFLNDVAGSSTHPETTANQDHIQLERCDGDVELINVSFAYPSNPSVNALNTSSFFFPAGEITYIIGSSGSGKSTIGNLVSSLYQPSYGQITLDGIDLADLSETCIRQNITLIQQASVVFDNSFFHNIALGHHNPTQVTREDALKACQAAMLQSTLSDLPDGLDTHVGVQGYELSGGQKQRLALARAHIRDPPVLILDEVTSGLEPLSRKLIWDAVRLWRHGKTTIVITHVVSHIEPDDFVYVLDNADIVQQGFKKDLLRDPAGLFVLLAGVSQNEGYDTFVSINDTPTNTDSDALRQYQNQPPYASLCQGTCEYPACGSPIIRTPSISQTKSHRTIGRSLSAVSETPCKRSENSPNITQEAGGGKGHLSKFLDSNFSSHDELVIAQLEKGRIPQSRYDDEATLEQSTSTRQYFRPQSFLFGTYNRRPHIYDLRHGVSNSENNHLSPPASNSVLLGPSQTPQQIDSMNSIIQTVWPCLGARQKLNLSMGLFSCLLGAAATPAFSYVFAQLLSVMWSDGNKVEQGQTWAVYLVGIAIIDALTTGAAKYFMESAAQAWVDRLRVNALRRILHQPRTWFDMIPNSPCRVTECLEGNAEEMRNIVGRFIPIVMVAFGIILVSVIWALAISWKLTLVALTPLPVAIGAVKGYSVVGGKWEKKCDDGAAHTSSVLAESILNIGVVKALMLEKYFRNEYNTHASQTLQLGLKRAIYTCGLFGLYQSTNYYFTSLVFYYATVLLTKGGGPSDVSRVLAVVNLLLFSVGTATEILGSVPQITLAQASATRLLEYTKLPDDESKRDYDQRRFPSIILPVQLTALTFSHSRQAPMERTLRGVSMTIVAGEYTAIVGSSGSGKSTIVSLCLGLYSLADTSNSLKSNHPPLTFAGIPSNYIDRHHLRSKIGYVPQSPFIFPASITENIAYGLHPNSPRRQIHNIHAAARAAGIHNFIASLPEGYNTVIGDGAQALSGGQSQRVGIARAIVRNPQLLIMDEPTSALDTESANIIRRTIRNLVAQLPTVAVVVVTHSVDMMRVANKIVVLEDGVTVQEGTFEDLSRSEGQFRHLLQGGEWTGLVG